MQTVADVMAISLDRLLAQVHLGVAFENGLAKSNVNLNENFMDTVI
jgi:hypothetical protein